MKKSIILGMVLVLIVLVALLLFFRSPNRYSRGENVPQTGERGVTLSAEERMETIRTRSRGGMNVIIATPIEFIEGTLAVKDFRHGDLGGAVYQTDYYFRVTEWLWGISGEEIIRVRSHVGNIFKIGGEYTVVITPVISILAESIVYSVDSQISTLIHSEVSELKLQEFHDEIRNIPPSGYERRSFVDYAIPTLDFLNYVDVAAVVTARNVQVHSGFENAFWFDADLKEVIRGEITTDMLSAISIRDNLVIGNDYLMLFRYSAGRTFLQIAARHGSVIPVGDPEFYQFMELFELAGGD